MKLGRFRFKSSLYNYHLCMSFNVLESPFPHLENSSNNTYSDIRRIQWDSTTFNTYQTLGYRSALLIFLKLGNIVLLLLSRYLLFRFFISLEYCRELNLTWFVNVHFVGKFMFIQHEVILPLPFIHLFKMTVCKVFQCLFLRFYPTFHLGYS